MEPGGIERLTPPGSVILAKAFLAVVMPWVAMPVTRGVRTRLNRYPSSAIAAINSNAKGSHLIPPLGRRARVIGADSAKCSMCVGDAVATSRSPDTTLGPVAGAREATEGTAAAI